MTQSLLWDGMLHTAGY